MIFIFWISNITRGRGAIATTLWGGKSELPTLWVKEKITITIWFSFLDFSHYEGGVIATMLWKNNWTSHIMKWGEKNHPNIIKKWISHIMRVARKKSSEHYGKIYMNFSHYEWGKFCHNLIILFWTSHITKGGNFVRTLWNFFFELSTLWWKKKSPQHYEKQIWTSHIMKKINMKLWKKKI